MKRLSILVLVVFVLVAALAACTPAPEVEPPHEHQFTDVWCADATHHWHVDTCDHEEEAVASKYEHRDADVDGMCDVCDYYIFYTFTVDAPDFVTVEGDLKGKNEDVAFTASVPTYYILSVEGAVQVGEAVVENGVATYTYKVANLSSADVEVVITAEQTGFINIVTSGEGEFLPEGEATSLPTWQNIYTTVKVNVPKAGTYIVKATNNDVTLALEGETTYSGEYTLVAAEAGEYTLSAKAYLWSAVESLAFDVVVYDVYETEITLPTLTGDGYTIPANNNMDPVYLTVTVPTPGAYIFTATEGLYMGYDSLANYIFTTTQENQEVEISVAVDEYYEDTSIVLAWNVAPLTFENLVLGENTITVPAKVTLPLGFIAAEAGDYMITCSDEYANFGSWNADGGYFGYPYVYQNEAITLDANGALQFAYTNYDYEAVELTITVAEYAAPVVEAQPLELGDFSINAVNSIFTYTALADGTLNIALSGAIQGSVEIKYFVNDGDASYVFTNANADVALNEGDVITIEVVAEGYSTMTTTWTTAGSEGGETPAEPDGSEENPYVFDGTTDLFVSISYGTPVYVTVEGGVTAYLTFDGYFMVNNSPATSVSPTEDTTYEIQVGMAGGMGYVTATDPNADSGEGEGEGSGETPAVESTLPIGNTQINAEDAEYTFVAETDGALILTQGGNVMPSNIVVVTYAINGGDVVTLVPQEGTTIELTKGDIVTVVITANSGYSSLTVEWFN